MEKRVNAAANSNSSKGKWTIGAAAFRGTAPRPPELAKIRRAGFRNCAANSSRISAPGSVSCNSARHPQRPYTLDFIRLLCTDFSELHGDRAFGDDPAIVGGFARFHGRPVLAVGHQKRPRHRAQRVARNFGQAKPEGYRKVLRLDEAGRQV